MAQRDIEIIIGKTGEVKVHIKGIKGKSCMKFGAFLADLVGKIKSQHMTSEYYEPDEKARIDLEQKQER